MIQVLLAMYEGEAFIDEQLHSITHQSAVTTQVLISDDGECNDDRRRRLREKFTKVSLITGTQVSPCHNFQHLLRAANPSASLYAFSDQDDVWLPNKLVTAQTKLAAMSNPLGLYMGRTIVCNDKLEPKRLSKRRRQPLSFRNALLESAAGGNTMVFTPALRALLATIPVAVHHDWLAYMVVSACGGELYFDNHPYVLYRQHSRNFSGNNQGIKAKAKRIYKLFKGEHKRWDADNIRALYTIQDQMTAENRRTFEYFVALHQQDKWHQCFYRLYLFRKAGLYRQRIEDQIAFLIAAFMGKL